MSVTPQQPVAGQGTAATYRVRLTNTGNVTERFTLTANLPAGISVVFSQDEVEVPPGLDNYREVSVTLQAATGSVPGSQPFTLAATATTTPNLSDQVTRTVQISRYGVAVDITPTSGVPLSPYQVTVRNTGQVQDTFTLALGGPAAPAASLASTALTLEAGASQTIPLEVGAIDFAYPGQMDLSVVATSQSDPAVQNTATTRLTIATSDQMEATITPAVVNLTAPGQGTFLVLVQNTGNRESAYQARISALNGNDTTATLTGLDDQPTQVIDSFRLPGLATGAIALNVAKTSPGTGSVTVTVTNLNQATVQDAATATLQIANQAPVADAGADRTLLVGQEITLDGSDSHDPDHGPQPLTYQWTFLAVPANSRLQNADLYHANTAQPRFTADVSGDYQVQLTVYDGELSATDSVTIQATNNPPVANAGPDLNLKLGTAATLDGSDSFDPDGQLIRYAWRLIQKPDGSRLTDADLQGANTPTPHFTPDVAGQYQLELKVRDIELESNPDTVQVTAFAANVTPNARAGEDRTVYVGDLVTLDGSTSFDPDTGPQALSYHWHWVELPATSHLNDQAITNALLAQASFVPDVPGVYRVILTVTDGEATRSDEVRLTAALPNVAPNANAGPDGKGIAGQPVQLDGSRSHDPDQSPQPLSYRWQFVYVPEGSQLTTAAIREANTATAAFIPDVAGQYVLRLEVSDGAGNAADNVLIEVTVAALPPEESAPTPPPEPKPQPVVIKGKSKGGGGSFGPLDLLLAALGLAILLRRSRRRRGLLMLLLAVIAWPAQADDPSGWYLGAGIGRASTNTHASEVEDRLADRGYTTDVHLDDDDNTGWKWLGGYRGGDYWGLEAAYVDLGKVTTQTTAQTTTPGDLAAAVAKVQPTAVRGLSLGPVAYVPLGEQVALTATAGLFIWKADSKAHLYTDNGTLTVHDSKNGTDWTAGAGVNFNPVPAITLRAAWDYYKADQDTHQLWSVQMIYWFGKSLSSAP